MKLINASNSPNVGLFVPFAHHQHYARGPRYYDPNCIPHVSYGHPGATDMQEKKGPFMTLAEAKMTLPSRRQIGKHGARGVNVLVPSDFPSYLSEAAKAEWTRLSANSPYHDDLPRQSAFFREQLPLDLRNMDEYRMTLDEWRSIW